MGFASVSLHLELFGSQSKTPAILAPLQSINKSAQKIRCFYLEFMFLEEVPHFMDLRML